MSKRNNKILIFLIMWLSMIIARVYGQTNVDLSQIKNQRGMAWQPNGQILAMGGIIGDQTGFWLYDVAANTVDQIDTPRNVAYISWSPDGQKIAGIVGSSATNDLLYQIFDVTTKQLISSFSQGSTDDEHLYWSADSTLIASVAGDHIDIRSVSTGNPIISLGYPVTAFQHSFVSAGWDSQRQRAYALRDDNQIFIWDTQSGDILQEIPLSSYSGRLSLSPDGTEFAVAGKEGKITLFDALTGNISMTLQSCTDNVIRDVVWNTNSDLLASYSFGKVIEIWNPATGERLDTWTVDPLIQAGTLAWKPDSSQLVYSMANEFPIFHETTATAVTKTPIPTATYTPTDTQISATPNRNN